MFQEMAGQTDVKIKKSEKHSRRISEHFSFMKQWGTPDEAGPHKETSDVFLTLMTNIENCTGGSKQTPLSSFSLSWFAICILHTNLIEGNALIFTRKSSKHILENILVYHKITWR